MVKLDYRNSRTGAGLDWVGNKLRGWADTMFVKKKKTCPVCV